MKNKLKFTEEVLFTLIIALILSGVIALILVLISGGLFSGLNQLDRAYPSINIISSIVFGLIVGYKLNTLIREHKS